MKHSPLELSVSQWFNTDRAVTLEQLNGRVVVVGAFQMLCPGCVAHSIPQLKKLHELSRDLPLTVIGLHTVFEHHQAMLAFPVGVAAYEGNSLTPKTMEDWHMRGTPSTFVFAANGDLSLHQFGHVDDLPLGIFVGQLIAAVNASTRLTRAKDNHANFSL
jgi:thiol-disulfide isomerase/thioredoxin